MWQSRRPPRGPRRNLGGVVRGDLAVVRGVTCSLGHVYSRGLQDARGLERMIDFAFRKRILFWLIIVTLKHFCPRPGGRRGPRGMVIIVVDPVLALSASVVKSVCKIWFRDDTLAADTSSTLVDLLQAKLARSSSDRNAGRLFDGMQGTVTRMLRPLIDVEFDRLDAGEREAALLAARVAFERARLGSEELVTSDLNALLVEQRVMAGTEELVRDLSPDARQLFRLVVSECCTYVVAYADRIPGFTVRALAEVLERQSRITKLISAPQRVPARAEIEPGVHEGRFTHAYRQQVASRLDRLDLFGATLSESVRQYSLSTAYISLAVDDVPAATVLTGKADPYALPSDELQPDLPAAIGGDVRIEQILAQTRRLLVRGDAGSGKTTLLQWLAVRSAQQDFPARLSAWNRTVPLLVRMRSHVDGQFPPPEDFVLGVGRTLAAEMPRLWVHELLHSGRALVLIDGIDELGESRRAAAQRWVGELVQDFPKARFVVTSRPTAASRDWLHRYGFDSATLRPLTGTDVQLFIKHWHNAVRADLPVGHGRAELREDERKLLRAAEARRHLRALATTPLLCALLCALHRDRRRQLPDNRMELYEAALQMLLDRRDREREIPDGNVILSYTDKRTLLRELALWLIENGWSDAPVDRARGQISRQLTRMAHIAAEPESVLRHLMDRSGLLSDPVEDRVAFVHRTFQEYLAAEAAIDSDKTGALVANAQNDHWFEVVIAAAGHARRREREEIVRDLLDRATREPEHSDRLRIAAIACLETAADLSPDLRGEVQDTAERILPPKTIDAAYALAGAGEAVLDLLHARPPATAAESTAVMRTASLVGGDAAIPLISQAVRYAPTGPGSAETSNPVHHEALRAWLEFHPRDYARQVLAPVIEALSVSDPGLLPALAELTRLTRLNITMGTVPNLNFVRSLPNLQWLTLATANTEIDLAPLADHANLADIHLHGVHHPDLQPLGTVPNLAHLTIHRGSQLTNGSALATCSSLTDVSIGYTRFDSIVDLRLPTTTTTLRLPSISDLTSLHPLTDLGDLPHLSTLDLADNTWLTDLSRISRWPALHSINLTGCTAITDLAPLAELPNLRHLRLNWIRKAELKPFTGFNELTVYVDVGQDVDDAPESCRIVRTRDAGTSPHGSQTQ